MLTLSVFSTNDQSWVGLKLSHTLPNKGAGFRTYAHLTPDSWLHADAVFHHSAGRLGQIAPFERDIAQACRHRSQDYRIDNPKSQNPISSKNVQDYVGRRPHEH